MAILLLLATAGVFVLGPEWPAHTSELTCDDGTVRGPFANMDACVLAMNDGCRACGVREPWYAPFFYIFYFLSIPALLVGALWTANKAIARGAAAVWIVLGVVLVIPFGAFFYPPGVWMPLIIQNAFVVWPQLVFFVPSLFRGASRPVESQTAQWAANLAFWFVAAVGFGRLTIGVNPRWVILPLAAGFVLVVVLLVRLTAPLTGFHEVLEFP